MNHMPFVCEALADSIIPTTTITAMDNHDPHPANASITSSSPELRRLSPQVISSANKSSDVHIPEEQGEPSCQDCQKSGRSTITKAPLTSHSEHTPSSSKMTMIMSLMPLVDDNAMDDWSSGTSSDDDDLDDSNATIKMSNIPLWRQQQHRHSNHLDYSRRRHSMMTEVASRWESFPSSRRLNNNASSSIDLSPPRRPITPPAPSDKQKAPRAPQRKSSLEATKRPTTTTPPPSQPIAQGLRRHISNEGDESSHHKNNEGNSSPSTSTLRLPTRQPSFENMALNDGTVQ